MTDINLTKALSDSIAAAKAEILADVADGTIPATVTSFSELHDYTDANIYGGGFHGEDVGLADLDFDVFMVDVVIPMQDAVDAWLKTSPSPLTPTTGQA